MSLFSSLAVSLVHRGRVRSIGCWLSISVTFLLYGATVAFNQSFLDPVGLSSDSRLIVAHRHSRQQSLPLRYLNKILAVPGVKEVSPRQSF